MDKIRKFDIKFDYSIIMLFSEQSETLIGGSEKILKRVLRNRENPNLNTKDLDIYYREMPLGTFALEIYQSAPEIEEIQNLVDKLYANLIDKRSNNTRVADTKLSLDALFNSAKNNTVIRVLARAISVWYAAVTDYYMNGKFGIPIPKKERAALGEQFRDDVNALIETIYTTLKKKKSPQNNTEIRQIIQFNCIEIGTFLEDYSRFLTSNRVFCIRCNLCDDYFIANSRNALYCVDCKLLRKKNSKKNYAEKCAEGIHKQRQLVKFRIENFMFKKKEWQTLSDNAKARYMTFRKKFVSETERMLKEYDKTKSKELELEIEGYLFSADTERARLEAGLWNVE